MSNRITRLAPSPTGALHLGNALAFLVNWALARKAGWQIVMRIEDLDGPRIKASTVAEMLDTLKWLGITWDGPEKYQSADLTPYRDAMAELAARQRVFSCNLSRSEIEAASSAPHSDDHKPIYPLHLRPDPAADPNRFHFSRLETNYRFIVPNEYVRIHDEITGEVDFHPASECGDFVVWTRRETPAYQLAVVVDDQRQGVTDVVRGRDLLPSAARQLLLYRALGWEPPRWWHLPLVVGPDGRRLAKRHGDSRLAYYRHHGATPERIIGLLALWCGIAQHRAPMSAQEFQNELSIVQLSREQIAFTEDDDQWLRQASNVF